MKRRRFVTLVAMSGAALLTSPLSQAMAAVERARGNRKAPAGRAASPAIRKEIATQEKSLADQLKVIRGYDLPPGSPMAFVFKPLRSRGRGRTRS
jgi:hypothetical protein